MHQSHGRKLAGCNGHPYCHRCFHERKASVMLGRCLRQSGRYAVCWRGGRTRATSKLLLKAGVHARCLLYQNSVKAKGRTGSFEEQAIRGEPVPGCQCLALYWPAGRVCFTPAWQQQSNTSHHCGLETTLVSSAALGMSSLAACKRTCQQVLRMHEQDENMKEGTRPR
jgi:hypothetical protein